MKIRNLLSIIICLASIQPIFAKYHTTTFAIAVYPESSIQDNNYVYANGKQQLAFFATISNAGTGRVLPNTDPEYKKITFKIALKGNGDPFIAFPLNKKQDGMLISDANNGYANGMPVTGDANHVGNYSAKGGGANAIDHYITKLRDEIYTVDHTPQFPTNIRKRDNLFYFSSQYDDKDGINTNTIYTYDKDGIEDDNRYKLKIEACLDSNTCSRPISVSLVLPPDQTTAYAYFVNASHFSKTFNNGDPRIPTPYIDQTDLYEHAALVQTYPQIFTNDPVTATIHCRDKGTYPYILYRSNLPASSMAQYTVIYTNKPIKNDDPAGQSDSIVPTCPVEISGTDIYGNQFNNITVKNISGGTKGGEF